MQEKTVTVASTTHQLGKPFVLTLKTRSKWMAPTRIPEAQLDRFFFKLNVEMPNHDEFSAILDKAGLEKPSQIEAVAGDKIIEMSKTACLVPALRRCQKLSYKAGHLYPPEKSESPDVVKQYTFVTEFPDSSVNPWPAVSTL